MKLIFASILKDENNSRAFDESEDDKTTELVFYILDGCLAIVFLLCALFYVILFVTKRTTQTKRFLMDRIVPSLSIAMLTFCLSKFFTSMYEPFQSNPFMLFVQFLNYSITRLQHLYLLLYNMSHCTLLP